MEKDALQNSAVNIPPFLGIKANQIEQWVDHNILARTRLAVFLRTLVHSTGRSLTKVDFPGNDDAERPGWDGFIEVREGTPWVPAGRSGWEFGTNESIKTKADNDFEKNVRAIEPKEREDITFVFVTPRRWPGKSAWKEAVKAQGLWKDVWAFDASDLEQWVEHSLPGQTWFANETGIPSQDVRSLDKCWADWANVSEPFLTGSLFSPAIEAAKRTMLSRLSNPLHEPTVIAADSVEEALAFLAQLFGELGGEELANYRDKVLVFDKPGVLPRLAPAGPTFIPVIHNPEVERELVQCSNSMHLIALYPRNAVNTEVHIVLQPITHEIFNKSLTEMGKGPDEISRLANESGRSLTVLRRRMAKVHAVRVPEWAAEHEMTLCLVPFLFVGAWDSKNQTDMACLSLLAGDRTYADLERDCQRLARLNDAPTWAVGTYRGVISKIDLLFAIAHVITPDDLERYFDVARIVLGEDDPALDLEEDKRWAASLYGKTREFSRVFRDGISETLVLLAVYGIHLFRERLGLDTELEARRVVRDLLPTPLTMRKLEANNHDLPLYAEAAPEAFLSIIERDLTSDTPAVIELMRPARMDILGPGPSRTGLLWALEGLSWNPETFPRASLILARLSQVEIDDNWSNKPLNSLKSIFRAWMPQTEASHEARVGLMKILGTRFPDVAWKICVAQFDDQIDFGEYNHKPRWRSDGYGFGEPLSTLGPVTAFQREMVEMALCWKNHTLSTLCDLIERLYNLDEGFQNNIWDLTNSWAKDNASDADKATLREKIRGSLLSRWGIAQAQKLGNQEALTEKAKMAYAKLEPENLFEKHAWLFRAPWIEESVLEIDDLEKMDYRA